MTASVSTTPRRDGPFRERVREIVNHPGALRSRDVLADINPELVGDARLKNRWSAVRKPASVLIPIVERPEGASIVLTVRSNDMPSHAGQISFPGGRPREDDPDPIATALREAHEEINAAPEHIDVVGALGEHFGGLGYSVTPVVGFIDPGAELRACPREVDEIFEIPFEFAIDLNSYITERHESLAEVPFSLYAAPFERFHIWGLTAAILRTLAVAANAGETEG